MRLYTVLGLLFVILTFIGAGYVLLNHGQVSAGYAVVPMIVSVSFLALSKQQRKDT